MFSLDYVPAVPLIQALVALGSLWTLYFCSRIIYNIYWHPLAKFPGPKLHAASSIPLHWATWFGEEMTSTGKIHDCYGPVVRVTPDTLSFLTAQSWKDIYGYRPGRIQLPKNAILYDNGRVPPLSGIVDDAEHARVRGLLSPAFSERAMREQESLIMAFIDLLIQKLKAQVRGPGGEVDLVRWYNFTTFDIIGDLALGQPFGSLENGEYHLWIQNIFNGLKMINILAIIKTYPILNAIMSLAVRFNPKAQEGLRVHREYTRVAIQKRLSTKTEKKDFLSYILHPKDQKGLTVDEMDENGLLLILAGSETTATALSAATYFLLTKQAALEKVCNEVRSAFQSEGSINFTSVAQLPYLNAVIEESLRLHPPVPTPQRRFTLPEGNTIDGHFVPGNTQVGICQWAAFRYKDNFRDPEDFVPERWLGDKAYAEDKRAAMQAFSFGARNCIGQTLAHAEMRTILARMLWHFDMELCEASKEWNNQRAFVLWEKPALMVKLTERTLR